MDLLIIMFLFLIMLDLLQNSFPFTEVCFVFDFCEQMQQYTGVRNNRQIGHGEWKDEVRRCEPVLTVE